LRQVKLPQPPPPLTIPHPIITVTEHTPTPSPDFMRRNEHVSWGGWNFRAETVTAGLFQGSIDSQLDALSLQGQQGAERKASLTRSQTDSNITYIKEEVLEAPGSAKYVTKDGEIDYQVVVKVSFFYNTCGQILSQIVVRNFEQELQKILRLSGVKNEHYKSYTTLWSDFHRITNFPSYSPINF
jgi:hypothetical protein